MRINKYLFDTKTSTNGIRISGKSYKKISMKNQALIESVRRSIEERNKKLDELDRKVFSTFKSVIDAMISEERDANNYEIADDLERGWKEIVSLIPQGYFAAFEKLQSVVNYAYRDIPQL